MNKPLLRTGPRGRGRLKAKVSKSRLFIVLSLESKDAGSRRGRSPDCRPG